MSSTNKTAKLKLPQFTATDNPTWLSDVNNAFKAIDDNVGKVTRTATVVVGLESSGYTENQVDVLIRTTDNVAGKIDEAIGKIPATGGEIKFLEGTYELQESILINPTRLRRTNVTLSGTGANTIFHGTFSPGTEMIKTYDNFGTVTIKDFTLSCNNAVLWSRHTGTVILSNILTPDFKILETAEAIDVKYYISNCPGMQVRKNASNWENIWIDGVASSPDGSITKWQDGRMEIGGFAQINVNADSANIIMPSTFINTDYSVFTSNGFAYIYTFFVTIANLSGSEFKATADATTVERTFKFIAIGRWK